MLFNRQTSFKTLRHFINSYPTLIHKHSVNTVTHLANAFDRPAYSASSNATRSEAGLFGVAELTHPHGFETLKENVLKTARHLVSEAIATSPSPSVITIFDNLSNELCKVADLAEFVRLAHPNESFARQAEEASFTIGGFVEQLNTHHDLYRALKNADKSTMDPDTEIVSDLFLFDFEQSGIHLDDRKRQLAVELHQTVLMIGAEFTKFTSAPRKYPVHLWPPGVRIPYAIDKNDILVDSTYSDSDNSKLREQCYKAYMYPCQQQQTLFESLLFVRDQLSTTLGFQSFAQRTLRGTMGKSPENVVNFLEATLEMLEEPLESDMNVIKEYQKIHTGCSSGKVEPWDVRLYTGVISSQMFNISSQKISEYFSVGACMNGLNLIFSSLYGVTLNVVECVPGEVWSADVQKLEVRHENEGLLGYIYCDFFQRSGKLQQDCHFTIRGGKLLDDGSYQLPIVSLICNFPRPRSDVPSLLSQNMVENLFHEMGHAMHSMLGRARYQHVTGTRCPTDFAEVPSILMEYFAKDPRILPLYATHYKNKQPLPDHIINGLHLSKKQFSSIDLQTQTYYALVDQKFHGKHPLGKPTTELLNDLHKQYRPFAHSAETAWHLRFSHFHSYASKYYSYVWSKAVASRIWHECFQKDPLSRSVGERYRDTMLKHGGGKLPQDMVENMLGRSVTVADLVNSLREDLK